VPTDDLSASIDWSGANKQTTRVKTNLIEAERNLHQSSVDFNDVW
jgi:hypothetical protein